MPVHSVAYHRGFTIDIHIGPAHGTPPVEGAPHAGPPYSVLWTVRPAHRPDQELGSFAEQPEFASTDEARHFAENRAHTFIQALLSLTLPETAMTHDADATAGHDEQAIARND